MHNATRPRYQRFAGFRIAEDCYRSEHCLAPFEIAHAPDLVRVLP
jgi:hypothetical protein